MDPPVSRFPTRGGSGRDKLLPACQRPGARFIRDRRKTHQLSSLLATLPATYDRAPAGRSISHKSLSRFSSWQSLRSVVWVDLLMSSTKRGPSTDKDCFLTCQRKQQLPPRVQRSASCRDGTATCISRLKRRAPAVNRSDDKIWSRTY